MAQRFGEKTTLEWWWDPVNHEIFTISSLNDGIFNNTLELQTTSFLLWTVWTSITPNDWRIMLIRPATWWPSMYEWLFQDDGTKSSHGSVDGTEIRLTTSSLWSPMKNWISNPYQLVIDYKKPLYGSSLTNQYNGMSQAFWSLFNWRTGQWETLPSMCMSGCSSWKSHEHLVLTKNLGDGWGWL